mmetsp:Transcript_69104/g.109031  ORF Transcript_69104/g.109031 Transcript_69104/m.109031 type:complete len:213 (+) Transcript_69104:494-1132(+)
MSLCLLQLGTAVDVLALVLAVLLEGLHGPSCSALQGIVILVVPAEIIRELPPHDRLFQEGFGPCLGHPFGGLLDSQGTPLRGNLAELDPRRKAGQGLLRRIIAQLREDLQPLLQELLQPLLACRSTRLKQILAHGLHVAIHLQHAQGTGEVKTFGFDRCSLWMPFQRWEFDQKLLQHFLDLWAQGAGAGLLLVRGLPDWHDIVSIHLNQRNI